MERDFPLNLDLSRVSTPAYIVSDEALEKNTAVLARVKEETGCRILLALKAFAMPSVFPLLRRTLDGTCASSPFEARLGKEHFGGQVHTFAAAYSAADMHYVLNCSDHVMFNSFGQWHRFRPLVEKEIAETGKQIQCGLRVNPEHSEAPAAIYDPSAPGSRLGIRAADFTDKSLDGISGLHFHTLCEQNADALERTLKAFEQKFGHLLHDLSWLNMGGGHHITRADYDVDLLIRLVNDIKRRYKVDVYLEPGEAVALNAGVLAATVLDIVHNTLPIAILDTSAATHMPDVLEMPYRPEVVGASMPGKKNHAFRLAGPSCLAGDVIGDYSFDEPLQIGSKLIFLDMAHYTMVKTNMFNGINLPSIIRFNQSADTYTIVRHFGFNDYISRL